MIPPPDSLEAALRAKMSRLSLTPGCVGDYDGAYDWVKTGSTDGADAPGDHPSTSGWPEDSYTVVEVGDPITLAAAVREWIKARMPSVDRYPQGESDFGYNLALADVARRLGL